MERLRTLQRRLSQWKIDELVIENPVDLFYLTRLSLSKGRLVISPDQAQLWVDGRYFAKASKEAPCSVALLEKGKGISGRRVGFDSDFTTVAALNQMEKEFPELAWIPIAQPLKEERAIKDDHELSLLRKAADVTWKGYQHVRSILREGISERDVALEFELFVRKSGASGLSFEPIIAFGANSAYPHYRAGEAKLAKNQIVLIDIGAVVDQYAADMTRVFFFGAPDRELERMMRIVSRAKQAAQAQIRIGAKFGDLDRAARAVFEQEGVLELYVHSLGHGIGLETHEAPRIKWDGEDRDVEIQAGMIFTIEPGLYRPNLGGVRLEDTIHVKTDGFEVLQETPC